MASYGPSYTSVVYIAGSSYRRYRGYLACTTSETNTTVTISYTAKVQMADAAQYGVKIAVSGGNSATGYLTSSSSSFKDVCTTTGTLSVTKGTSATTKTVTATASGTTVSGYGSAGGSASVSINVTIPAKPSYTVSYNLNGGESSAIASQTKWYGTTLTLSSTVPTRTGYNFLGWSTSSTATTATYSAGGSYTSNSAATLYAVWELAYATPVISNLTAVRCDASGNATAIGRYAKVSFDWELDPALTFASGAVACGDQSVSLAAVEAAAGSASEIIGGSLDPLSAYSITATVNDSAGLSTTETIALAAEEHSLPTISSLVAIRTDAEGNYDEEGTCGSVSFAWTVDEMDGTNAIDSVSIGYREKGSEDDYVDLTATFEGTTSGTAAATITGGALDVAKSYDIKLVVADQVSSITRTTVITRSFFTLDFKAGGKGIAVGKAAENDGLEVAMDASFEGAVTVRGHALTSIQQATFYSSEANATESTTGWATMILNEVKAKTSGFDDVATFADGVITFLKDGCYELSGSIYWSSGATAGGIGIFNGDVEESSAFFLGTLTQMSAILIPVTVSVTAGETRTFKRRGESGAYLRYGCYSWFTIKYLG